MLNKDEETKNSQVNAQLGQQLIEQNTDPQAMEQMATPENANIAAGQTPFPKFTGEKQYVPGVGLLGADLGGYVKGVQAAQDYALNEATNVRANEQMAMQKDYLTMAKSMLGINLSKFSMEQRDDEKEQFLQKGMLAGAQAGGYAGVIDFLQTQDPERAVLFHANKLKLDDALMKNQVLQAKLPNDLDQAMFDSYAVLGKFGAAIMRMKPEDRQNAYSNILPMVQKVLPNAPKDVKEAMGLFQLAIAQATPENQLATSNSNSAFLKTEIGETMAAMNELYQQGADADDPAIKALNQHLEGIKSKDVANSLQALKAQKAIQGAAFDDRMAVQKMMNQQSKSFVDNMEPFADMMGIVQAIDEHGADSPKAALAVNQLRMLLIRSTQKGVLTEQDFQRGQAAAGITAFSKNVLAWTRGAQVQLLPWEVDQAKELVNAIVSNRVEQQQRVEAQYKDFVSSNPDVVWDEMIIPSKQFEQLVDPKNAAKNQMSNVDPADLQAVQQDPRFLAAFQRKYGFNPLQQGQ